MSKTKYIGLLLLPLLISLSGCGNKPSVDDKVLVTVANKFITLKDFKHKLSRLPSYYQGMAEKNKKTLLNDMIAESLFLEDAVRKGMDRDSEIRELLDEARKKIIIAKFIKTEVDDKLKVSDEDIKKFYEAHKDDFKKPGMWRASHILVASEGGAKEILNELSNGKPFEELARAKSIDATASRGGDVGYFRKGQVIPEFENTCFNLKVGGTSGIVHTQFGYHIIKLTDKKEGQVESLEEAGPKIENELAMKKRNELFGKLVTDLKTKYHVRVEEDTMKTLNAMDVSKRPKE